MAAGSGELLKIPFDSRVKSNVYESLIMKKKLLACLIPITEPLIVSMRSQGETEELGLEVHK